MSADTGSMVSLRALNKTFGGRPAIRDISIEVDRGEIFGLLGHNGAGKSTTFGIMLGMVAPDSGEALIGGKSVQRERAAALASAGAIFETPSFYDYLSGWENLAFFVSLSGRRIPRRELEEAVGRAGLSDRIGSKVGTYSHGMRQRLGLAQALVPRPEFLLLDEPTDGLDPLGIREIRETIRSFRDDLGITVMLSSHLLAEVEHLCDRVAILHQGRLVFCGEWRTASRRWKFQCEPEAAASEVLRSMGLTECGGHWESGPDFDPAATVAAMVAAGIAVRGVTPSRQTLEDFYLERLGS